MSIFDAVNRDCPDWADDLDYILNINEKIDEDELWEFAREYEKPPIFGNVYLSLFFPRIISKISSNIIEEIDIKISDMEDLLSGIDDEKLPVSQYEKIMEDIKEQREVFNDNLEDCFDYYINSIASSFSFNDEKAPWHGDIEMDIYDRDDAEKLENIIVRTFVFHINKHLDLEEEIKNKFIFDEDNDLALYFDPKLVNKIDKTVEQKQSQEVKNTIS